MQKDKIQFFQNVILNWYSKNKRDLPWRTTTDPYKIIVSEIMLQQTQVDRVIPKYQKFLETFPTIEALEKAPLSQVIELWAGLGYNRRAVNLQAMAKQVTEEYQGRMPKRIEQLQTLKGIGPYTASAVACFAFAQDVPVIDTNIRRIMDRYYGNEERSGKQREQITFENTKKSVPNGKGVAWNNALMDFGSLVCTAKNPQCASCPLKNDCNFFRELQTLTPEQQKKIFETTKKQPSFKHSTRYYRGQILKLIRENKTIEEEIVLTHILKEEKLDKTTAKKLIQDLMNDQLLEKNNTKLQLPQHAITHCRKI